METIRQASSIIEKLYTFQLAKYNLCNFYCNSLRDLYWDCVPEDILCTLMVDFRYNLYEKLSSILDPATEIMEVAVVNYLCSIGFSINIANAIVYNGQKRPEYF